MATMPATTSATPSAPKGGHALAEERQRQDRHQRHAEPTRDRVDDRQIAAAYARPSTQK